MPNWLMIAWPVSLAAGFASIGALFLELRDHRDRLIRLEERFNSLLWVLKENGRAPGS